MIKLTKKIKKIKRIIKFTLHFLSFTFVLGYKNLQILKKIVQEPAKFIWPLWILPDSNKKSCFLKDY